MPYTAVAFVLLSMLFWPSAQAQTTPYWVSQGLPFGMIGTSNQIYSLDSEGYLRSDRDFWINPRTKNLVESELNKSNPHPFAGIPLNPRSEYPTDLFPKLNYSASLSGGAGTASHWRQHAEERKRQAVLDKGFDGRVKDSLDIINKNCAVYKAAQRRCATAGDIDRCIDIVAPNIRLRASPSLCN